MTATKADSEQTKSETATKATTRKQTKSKNAAVNLKRLIQAPSSIVDQFIKNSVINETQIHWVGDDIMTRFCALHGITRFTKTGGECVAHLDPNFRDEATTIPYCFPMAARVFFAGVVKSEDSPIERLVPVRLEPHGRLVVLGDNEPCDLPIRLDNIAFQPLMKAHTVPRNCAPYCFPTAKLNGMELGVAGCVKYCEPPQDVQQEDFTTKPSPCKCGVLKRLSCFLHEGSNKTTFGQFKMLMGTRAAERDSALVAEDACNQICAGQVSAF